jgi:selenocysteine-specific elongation factor
MVEIPNLKIEKKVKSMQMFKRPVQSCARGDRLGMLAGAYTCPLFRST